MSTLTKKISDWAGRMAGARTALEELRATDTEIRATHAAAIEERARLVTARAPRAELVPMLEAQVDAIAERWRQEHEARVVAAIGGAVDAGPHGEILGVRQGNLAAEFGMLTFEPLCALLPNLIKSSLTSIVNATVYPEGPPMTDRARLIAATDARIAEVEVNHGEFVDHAASLGVTLEPMAENRARAIAATRKREYEEREARDRARRIRN